MSDTSTPSSVACLTLSIPGRVIRFLAKKIDDSIRFDLILGQIYKGKYNYQHLAIIDRPVMQSGVLVFASFV